MRKLLPLLIVGLVIAALAGCGNDAEAPTGFVPGETSEAYNYVHGGYVGRAVATSTDDGGFTVELNEAFLPHVLAEVDMEADEWTADNTVSYVSHGSEVPVAKWVSYAGTMYTGTSVGTAVVWVASDDQGNAAGGTDLELAIIRDERSMKAYWDGIANGEFMVYSEFGGTGSAVTTSTYGSLYKRGSNYWTNGKTWAGNMDAIQEAAAEYGIAFTLDEISRNADNEWQLADAVTAATASDFTAYFGLIQTAVARLPMQ